MKQLLALMTSRRRSPNPGRNEHHSRFITFRLPQLTVCQLLINHTAVEAGISTYDFDSAKASISCSPASLTCVLQSTNQIRPDQYPAMDSSKKLHSPFQLKSSHRRVAADRRRKSQTTVGSNWVSTQRELFVHNQTRSTPERLSFACLSHFKQFGDAPNGVKCGGATQAPAPECRRMQSRCCTWMISRSFAACYSGPALAAQLMSTNANNVSIREAKHAALSSSFHTRIALASRMAPASVIWH